MIGLYGKWGSGKTSTVNLIIEHIDFLTKNNHSKPSIHFFSSWGSNSVLDVFTIFMDSFSKESGKIGRAGKTAKELSKSLLEYGECLDYICPPLGGIAKGTKTLLKKPKRPQEAKRRVSKILEKQPNKTIVIIDDIDRLSDEQIKHVFQFVNVIADFPNVVYILPFDFQVVSNALANVQGKDGLAYMNKIIQIPLYLPDPEPNSLLSLLNDEISSLLDTNREDYDRSRMFQIVKEYLTPYIKTPRDVRRVQNIYSFQMELFSEGLNSLDLLALSTLMALRPNLYEWIKNNKHLALGKFGYGQKDAHDKDLRTTLESYGVSPYEMDATISMLSILFPKIKGIASNQDSSYWRERRVCHEEIFDGYFAGRQKETWLSNRVYVDAIYAQDLDTLHKLMKTSIREGSTAIILEEIDCRLHVFSSEALDSLARLLIEFWGQSTEDTRGSFFFFTTDTKIEILLNKIFEKTEKETADEIMLSSIPQMTTSALAAATSFIRSEELAYGRFADDSLDETKQHLTLNGLIEIEAAFLLRLSELNSTYEFLEHNDLARLSYLWISFDEQGFVEYWQNLIESKPINVCYLLNASSGRWSSGEAYGWTFSKDIIEKITDQETIISNIELLKGSGAFSFVPDVILEKVISFYYIGFKGIESYERITAQDCRQRFSEWR